MGGKSILSLFIFISLFAVFFAFLERKLNPSPPLWFPLRPLFSLSLELSSSSRLSVSSSSSFVGCVVETVQAPSDRSVPPRP